jgi:hypothetical protein
MIDNATLRKTARHIWRDQMNDVSRQAYRVGTIMERQAMLENRIRYADKQMQMAQFYAFDDVAFDNVPNKHKPQPVTRHAYLPSDGVGEF